MSKRKLKKLLLACLSIVLLWGIIGAIGFLNKTPKTLLGNGKKVKEGDIVTFGTYEQTTDEEVIEWIVLRKDGEKALLLSKYILDNHYYHGEKWYYDDSEVYVTWENSDIRNWLNEHFYEMAFSEEEKEIIIFSTQENQENPYYGTYCGDSTKDYVFLLAYDDITEYQEYVGDKQAKEVFKTSATGYAISQGAHTYDGKQK